MEKKVKESHQQQNVGKQRFVCLQSTDSYAYVYVNNWLPVLLATNINFPFHYGFHFICFIFPTRFFFLFFSFYFNFLHTSRLVAFSKRFVKQKVYLQLCFPFRPNTEGCVCLSFFLFILWYLLSILIKIIFHFFYYLITFDLNCFYL